MGASLVGPVHGVGADVRVRQPGCPGTPGTGGRSDEDSHDDDPADLDRDLLKVLTDRPPTNEASKGDLLVVGSTLRNAVAQFGRAKGAVAGDDTVISTIRSPTRADVIVETNLPLVLPWGDRRLAHKR